VYTINLTIQNTCWYLYHCSLNLLYYELYSVVQLDKKILFIEQVRIAKYLSHVHVIEIKTDTHFSARLSSGNSLTRLTFMLYLRSSKLTMPYLIRPQPLPFEITPCLKWATTTSFRKKLHASSWPQPLPFEITPCLK